VKWGEQGDLVAEVAKWWEQRKAEDAVSCVLDTLRSAEEGANYDVGGFGTFRSANGKPAWAGIPDRQRDQDPGKKVPKFSAGKALKSA